MILDEGGTLPVELRNMMQELFKQVTIRSSKIKRIVGSKGCEIRVTSFHDQQHITVPDICDDQAYNIQAHCTVLKQKHKAKCITGVKNPASNKPIKRLHNYSIMWQMNIQLYDTYKDKLEI
jgi:hypothetical protein